MELLLLLLVAFPEVVAIPDVMELLLLPRSRRWSRCTCTFTTRTANFTSRVGGAEGYPLPAAGGLPIKVSK